MRRIEVSVRPGASKEVVVPLGTGHYKVCVTARAADGKANEAVREALARYFGVPKSAVSFFKGLKSRSKIIDIQDQN